MPLFNKKILRRHLKEQIVGAILISKGSVFQSVGVIKWRRQEYEQIEEVPVLLLLHLPFIYDDFQRNKGYF